MQTGHRNPSIPALDQIFTSEVRHIVWHGDACANRLFVLLNFPAWLSPIIAMLLPLHNLSTTPFLWSDSASKIKAKADMPCRLRFKLLSVEDLLFT